MPEHSASTFLAGAGTDTWTLWLNIMATGAAVALLLLLSVFTLALYLYRDREAPAALQFALANLCATVYIASDLTSRIDAVTGDLDAVMTPYRVALSAVVMGLAALICMHRVLRRRHEPRWRLAAEAPEGSDLARHKLRRRLEDFKQGTATTERGADDKLASGFLLRE